MIEVIRAKLHGIKVTNAHLDYQTALLVLPQPEPDMRYLIRFPQRSGRVSDSARRLGFNSC